MNKKKQPQKRTYTAEFKREVFRLYETTDKSMAQVKRELRITSHMPSKWVRKHRQAGEQAFPVRSNLLEEEQRIRQLEREVAILRQEREILNKAVAISSHSKG